MTCSSCTFLKDKEKTEGKVSGACYYCSKCKTYVNGSNNKCVNYEKSYGRTNNACDKIYNEGLQYYDDDKPVIFYVIELLIFLFLAIIINIYMK